MVWYIPVLIFVARILDVSLGTVRTIMVIRGRRYTAAILGFFEVIVWVLAIASALVYLHESVWALLAYAGGFAVGNLVGIHIEQKIALGDQALRVVNTNPHINLAKELRNHGFPVTQLMGEGLQGSVELCYMVLPRKKSQQAMQRILALCPSAFMTVEDVALTSTHTLRDLQSRAPAWRRVLKL